MKVTKINGIYVTGDKEFLYQKCKGCIYASFRIAQGLNPNYGWWYMICKRNHERDVECHPSYKNEQLSLF